MRKPIGALSADWHLDKDNIETKKGLISQICDEMDILGIDDLYCLGDIFEDRKAQPLINLDGFDEILDLIEKRKKRLKAFPGNHDKTSYLSEKSFLNQFRFHHNFDLYSCYSAENQGLPIMFHYIPYFDENSGLYLKYLNLAIKEIDNYNSHISEDLKKDCAYKNILLTHVSIDGVHNNDYNVVQNDIKQSLFEKFDLVLVGHYHDRSEVGKNIKYIGSLNQTNFGEDEDKGFVILYDDLSLEYRNLEFKKYKKIEINLKEKSFKQIDTLLNEYSNSKDKIRFEFIGDKEELKILDDNKFKSVGIDVKKKQLELENGIIEAAQNQFVSFTKTDIINEFGDFCKLKKIKDVKYGKDLLLKKLK